MSFATQRATVLNRRITRPFMSSKPSPKSLLEGYPSLAAEWHPTKNGKLTPADLVPGSGKKVWWLASCGHEWETRLYSRTKAGSGCPFCANQKVLFGFNDLMTLHPAIAAQFHNSLNAPVRPDQIITGSNKKYWWQCESGHKWETSVASRTRNSSQCPVCTGLKLLAGVNDLATTHPELAAQWHPTKNEELKPSQIRFGSEKKIWWIGSCGHEWASVPYSRKSAEVGCPVCSGRKIVQGENDLATTHSDLASEWHPTKNGGLKPTEVVRGTRRKVWWLCESGHEWESVVANRVWGNGCPYCAGQWVIKGENDLATINSDLANQFHPTKNGDLKPTELMAVSGKRVWWLCEYGHEWNAKLSSRQHFGLGCPICSNQRLLPGFNDLATKYPEVAGQWHPTKNGDLLPSQIAPNTFLKPWWLALCGHEWQADVGSRVRGSNCPYCSNQRLLEGFNDLATHNPAIAIEWHPTRNEDLLPTQITHGTNAKAWWLGNCGHEWEARVYLRAKGAGCPVCGNFQLLIGFNDLATLGTDIMHEWHATKNMGIDPAKVVGPSGVKYWWQCSAGHEWMATGAARLRGTGCPNCATKGYSSAMPGTFYFIQDATRQVNKIGISNQSSSRLSEWLEAGWVLLWERRDQNGLHIANLERVVLRWIRKDLGLPPYLSKEDMGRMGGWSETFDMDAVSTSQVIEAITQLEEELRDFDS